MAFVSITIAIFTTDKPSPARQSNAAKIHDAAHRFAPNTILTTTPIRDGACESIPHNMLNSIKTPEMTMTTGKHGTGTTPAMMWTKITEIRNQNHNLATQTQSLTKVEPVAAGTILPSDADVDRAHLPRHMLRVPSGTKGDVP